RSERLRDDELHGLEHQAAARGRLERVVAERPGMARVADDVVDVHDAGELVRAQVDYEKRRLSGAPLPVQIARVRLARARRLAEHAVQPAAAPHRGKERLLAAR